VDAVSEGHVVDSVSSDVKLIRHGELLRITVGRAEHHGDDLLASDLLAAELEVLDRDAEGALERRIVP
jgi:hypothetical protein